MIAIWKQAMAIYGLLLRESLRGRRGSERGGTEQVGRTMGATATAGRCESTELGLRAAEQGAHIDELSSRLAS